MFLKKSISRGRIFLSFVQGYRINGKVKHKTIEKIGYLDELEKIYDNPIAHFKAVAKEKSKLDQIEKKLEVTLNQKLENNTSTRKNLGYSIPKQIYSQLKINNFFQNKQKHLNIEYNLNSIFSLLTYNRILFPSSKKKAFDKQDSFFESYKFSLDDIYRALDYFAMYSEQLQKHLHEQVSNTIGRDNKIGYYDVTNYYFEIPYSDEDIYDESGDLIKKGFRKNGPSKEHRKTPITQMGLLMDSNGIPMAFNTFSGGDSEKTSLLPVVKRVKKDYELERIVIIADRGLNTSDNTVFLSGVNDDKCKNNNGYIYGQSILGADKNFKLWVLKTDEYTHTEEINDKGEKTYFVHKSRIYAKTIQLKNSKGKRTLKMTIYQKQMVYFSKKYAKKQKKDRLKVIEKAKKLIKNPGMYTKASSYGAIGYINNIKFNKETGEIPDGLELSLNIKKIKEEAKFDGYYSIVTSEKNLSDKKLHTLYKGLWEIEESFKIIKSELSARPMYVRIENHINGHLLICFVSLLIMRLIQHKINKEYSISRIRESLANYSCSYLDQNYYLFDYRDEILQSFEKVFGLDFSDKYMNISKIKKILQYQKSC